MAARVEFQFSFPLWLIVNHNAGSNGGAVIHLATATSGEVVVPIFSDDDLAARYISRMLDSGFSPLAVTDPKLLIAFLSNVRKDGIARIVMDFDLDAKIRRIGRIDDFIKMLRKQTPSSTQLRQRTIVRARRRGSARKSGKHDRRTKHTKTIN